jgi:hypothetical protein
MLGFLAAVQPVATPESMRQAMLGAVPPRTRETNTQAFDRGLAHGQAQLQGKGKGKESGEAS